MSITLFSTGLLSLHSVKFFTSGKIHQFVLTIRLVHVFSVRIKILSQYKKDKRIKKTFGNENLKF